ncbi:MAG: hypothetical protein ACHREM_13505 [Polyangiales bacterium]
MFDALDKIKSIHPATLKSVGEVFMTGGVGAWIYQGMGKPGLMPLALFGGGVVLVALASSTSSSSVHVAGQSNVSKELDPAFTSSGASSVKYVPWLVGGLLAGTAALMYVRAVS